MNKKKIINDPIYGFIPIRTDLIFDIIEHPYFQRLRRIKQMGLTDLVYPGAHNTRFHHALGAMHLMSLALETLKSKGIEVTSNEFEGALIAILLHDIGHGPFSHALESTLLQNVHHEEISLVFMKKLNQYFDGQLDTAIEIFTGTYEKKFLHQLVSGQLDIDRLDYLNRDCYFTGVNEGIVSFERIINMLNVVDDEIVVEEKGIYSIENFLNARRLMYWQVYLHKTSISAELMLIQIIKRAKFCFKNSEPANISEPLKYFLKKKITLNDFYNDSESLAHFSNLDDIDVMSAIKYWANHSDKVLSILCKSLINRKLFSVTLQNLPINSQKVETTKAELAEKLGLSKSEISFLVITGNMTNSAYISGSKNINILLKSKKILDIADASDLPNIKALRKIVRKYYLCNPKNIYL